MVSAVEVYSDNFYIVKLYNFYLPNLCKFITYTIHYNRSVVGVKDVDKPSHPLDNRKFST